MLVSSADCCCVQAANSLHFLTQVAEVREMPNNDNLSLYEASRLVFVSVAHSIAAWK